MKTDRRRLYGLSARSIQVLKKRLSKRLGVALPAWSEGRQAGPGAGERRGEFPVAVGAVGVTARGTFCTSCRCRRGRDRCGRLLRLQAAARVLLPAPLLPIPSQTPVGGRTCEGVRRWRT